MRPMKRLVTLMMCAVSLGAAAQNQPWEFPWNPDANGDDLIGVADLQSFLSVYGDEFTEEQVLLDNDSSSMLVFGPQLGYYQCVGYCQSLTPSMNMADMKSLIPFMPIEPSQLPNENIPYAWLYRSEFLNLMSTPTYLTTYFPEGNITLTDNAQSAYITSEGLTCICAISERPKVEYGWCAESNHTAFNNCVETYLSEGYWPLGGLGTSSNGSGGEIKGQAFWRWAE